jgi:hypothetical protein
MHENPLTTRFSRPLCSLIATFAIQVDPLAPAESAAGTKTPLPAEAEQGREIKSRLGSLTTTTTEDVRAHRSEAEQRERAGFRHGVDGTLLDDQRAGCQP